MINPNGAVPPRLCLTAPIPWCCRLSPIGDRMP